jgi:REP element-mobilizing transposase RayT
MESRLEYKPFYRRNLPHIVSTERPLFVTFTTMGRTLLPPGARTIALRHALHSHGERISVDVVVVMPDHMHLIFSLLLDEKGNAPSLGEIMKGIKGASSRRINQLLGRHGTLWQDESFDRVLRRIERSRAKYEYVCQNPVRAGLAASPNDYPWLWRSWIEGSSVPFAPCGGSSSL